MIKDLRAQGDLYLDGKPVCGRGVLSGRSRRGCARRGVDAQGETPALRRSTGHAIVKHRLRILLAAVSILLTLSRPRRRREREGPAGDKQVAAASTRKP